MCVKLPSTLQSFTPYRMLPGRGAQLNLAMHSRMQLRKPGSALARHTGTDESESINPLPHLHPSTKGSVSPAAQPDPQPPHSRHWRRALTSRLTQIVLAWPANSQQRQTLITYKRQTPNTIIRALLNLPSPPHPKPTFQNYRYAGQPLPIICSECVSQCINV